MERELCEGRGRADADAARARDSQALQPGSNEAQGIFVGVVRVSGDVRVLVGVDDAAESLPNRVVAIPFELVRSGVVPDEADIACRRSLPSRADRNAHGVGAIQVQYHCGRGRADADAAGVARNVEKGRRRADSEKAVAPGS